MNCSIWSIVSQDCSTSRDASSIERMLKYDTRLTTKVSNMASDKVAARSIQLTRSAEWRTALPDAAFLSELAMLPHPASPEGPPTR
jgi:hypothetical protein